MTNAPPFAALQAFEAAGRHLSFRIAADELNVTPSAISHRIRGLEQIIGVQLFRRRPGAIALSPAGCMYLQQIQDVFQRIEAASRCLKSTDGIESLSAHATLSFGTVWLMPKISEFVRRYPHIQVKVDASPTPANFTTDKVNVDIRYGRPAGRELHVEPLAGDRIAAFCSRDYFEQIGRPGHPRDLRDASLIQVEGNKIQWSEWLTTNGADDVDLPVRLQTTRSLLALEAAVSGLGIVLESHVLCDRYLRSGLLMKMFPDEMDVVRLHYFLVCPRNYMALPSVRLFRDWLTSEMQIYDAVAFPPVNAAE